MITQTSIDAFISIKEKINERQKQVLHALEEIAPASNRQIAEHSNMPINTVTPRIGELRKKGYVVQAYISKDITGRRATYWKPKGFKDEFTDID